MGRKKKTHPSPPALAGRAGRGRAGRPAGPRRGGPYQFGSSRVPKSEKKAEYPSPNTKKTAGPTRAHWSEYPVRPPEMCGCTFRPIPRIRGWGPLPKGLGGWWRPAGWGCSRFRRLLPKNLGAGGSPARRHPGERGEYKNLSGRRLSPGGCSGPRPVTQGYPARGGWVSLC